MHGHQQRADDSNLCCSPSRWLPTPRATIAGQLAYIAVGQPDACGHLLAAYLALGLSQPGGDKLDTNPRNVRLPGYKGSAAQCPAGPLGSTTLDGVTLTLSTG